MYCLPSSAPFPLVTTPSDSSLSPILTSGSLILSPPLSTSLLNYIFLHLFTINVDTTVFAPLPISTSSLLPEQSFHPHAY